MTTRKELIKEIEELSEKLVGTRFKYNPLNGMRGYKHWNTGMLEEFKEKFLS